MNIRKIIPLLLLAVSVAAFLFYACGSSQSATSGTGGSKPDTAKATTVKSNTLIPNGTGGSRPDTSAATRTKSTGGSVPAKKQ